MQFFFGKSSQNNRLTTILLRLAPQLGKSLTPPPPPRHCTGLKTKECWCPKLEISGPTLSKEVSNFSTVCENIIKQERPPAWTQEAYRLRRIKYSICYPKWGALPQQGYPAQPGLMGGTWGGVPPGWGTPTGLMGWGVPEVGTPGRGTTYQVLMGVPKVWYPCPQPGGVPPYQVWWGTWGGVPPSRPGWGTPPSGPGWGTPPRCGQTDGWTDTCQNITFPSYHVRGR